MITATNKEAHRSIPFQMPGLRKSVTVLCLIVGSKVEFLLVGSDVIHRDPFKFSLLLCRDDFPA